MKTYFCPACGSKYAIKDFVCEHCGKIIASYGNVSYAVLNEQKFRLSICSFYIAEKRCIIKTDSDYYDNLGLFGAAMSIAADAKQSAAKKNFDSPWENITDLQYPNGRIGTVLNGISPNHGIIITYSDGAKIAVGLAAKKAEEAYFLMSRMTKHC